MQDLLRGEVGQMDTSSALKKCSVCQGDKTCISCLLMIHDNIYNMRLLCIE